jgi:hypothetical protein
LPAEAVIPPLSQQPPHQQAPPAVLYCSVQCSSPLSICRVQGGKAAKRAVAGSVRYVVISRASSHSGSWAEAGRQTRRARSTVGPERHE